VDGWLQGSKWARMHRKLTYTTYAVYPYLKWRERNARTFKYGQFTEEETVAKVQQLISCKFVYLASINCKLFGCKSYVVTGLAIGA